MAAEPSTTPAPAQPDWIDIQKSADPTQTLARQAAPPQQQGETVTPIASNALPNDPLLVQFLRSAKRCADAGPFVFDAAGFERSYRELLADVLVTRERVRAALPAEAFEANGMLAKERPYVCVLVGSGYEYLVAFFATRALGGACIPFASGVLPEEGKFFIETSKSACLLTGASFAERGSEIVALSKAEHSDVLTLIISSDAEPLKELDAISIDENVLLDAGGPGLVIFTSGTTGTPKGCVLPRRCMLFMPDAGPDSETLCYRPPHWLGGTMSLVIPALTGAKLHALREDAGIEAIWELLLRRRITGGGWTPRTLRALMEHVEAQPAEEQARYVAAFKSMPNINCAGAMVSPLVAKWWIAKTGMKFVNVYGSTEGGGFATHRVLDGTEPPNSIGVPIAGIQVKLAEGDHGEICVKSPFMITHYIGKEGLTKEIFDEEGFFRTGDCAEFKDGEYIFAGRANTDYAFYRGLRIPTVQVEVALTALPYITEASVLGVPDHESKELCGTVVQLTPDALRRHESGESPVTLARLRADLDAAESLPAYMQPMLLRVLRGGEDVPETVSSKPIKRKIVRVFFTGEDGYWDADKSFPGVEFAGYNMEKLGAATAAATESTGSSGSDGLETVEREKDEEREKEREREKDLAGAKRKRKSMLWNWSGLQRVIRGKSRFH